MLCPRQLERSRIEAHLRVLRVLWLDRASPETLVLLGFRGFVGAPDWNRTSDLWLRRPTLYPTELRVRMLKTVMLTGMYW